MMWLCAQRAAHIAMIYARSLSPSFSLSLSLSVSLFGSICSRWIPLRIYLFACRLFATSSPIQHPQHHFSLHPLRQLLHASTLMLFEFISFRVALFKSISICRLSITHASNNCHWVALRTRAQCITRRLAQVPIVCDATRPAPLQFDRCSRRLCVHIQFPPRIKRGRA